MAMVQNLATSVYTLGSFKANVRRASSTLSQQESGLIELQLNDIIHGSVMLVRALMGKLIDKFYITRQSLSMTIASGAGNVDISSYSIADMTKISLFDSSATTLMKEIPVLSNADFNALRTLYSTTDMLAGTAIATIKSTGTGPFVNKLYIHTKSDTADTETLHMFYPRNPIKVVTDIDSIDLPDFLIPIAQDIATVNIFRKTSKTPPAEIESRVTGFINSQVAMLGLKVSPQKEG